MGEKEKERHIGATAREDTLSIAAMQQGDWIPVSHFPLAAAFDVTGCAQEPTSIPRGSPSTTFLKEGGLLIFKGKTA